MTDDVATAGKMTEALERIERARGHLYEFHQLIGSADAMLDDVVDGLGGHPELQTLVGERLRGRNVLDGRWTFQVVEEFDDGYWSQWRACETAVRDALTGGCRHVHEARMKQERRSPGRPGHDAEPGG